MINEVNNKAASRDPERSREAILDAAEKLFASKGYEETSLQEIGQLAGVSRGTPNYFFGSKEQLYGTVLDRVILAEYEAVSQTLLPSAIAKLEAKERIAGAISSFIDFLIARPTFIQLIEREALNDARFLQKRSAYLDFFNRELELVKTELATGSYRSLDPVQLLLSITALCWFPLAHTNTFLQPLGIRASDTLFWEQRKQHIIELILYGILETKTP